MLIGINTVDVLWDACGLMWHTQLFYILYFIPFLVLFWYLLLVTVVMVLILNIYLQHLSISVVSNILNIAHDLKTAWFIWDDFFKHSGQKCECSWVACKYFWQLFMLINLPFYIDLGQNYNLIMPHLACHKYLPLLLAVCQYHWQVCPSWYLVSHRKELSSSPPVLDQEGNLW